MSKLKKSIFTGAATALITPFKNGKIDYERLKQLIDQQINGGIDALVEDSSVVVETSAAEIKKSLEVISGLDVEGLNKSIKALETVTRSIGRLFGYNG